MPRELYNEGRVVGYSAYELYVKHALSEFPNDDPASEREWLAAQLGHGSSMVLKISAENENLGVHKIDIPLPENSKLLAANTIIGSPFFGNCSFNVDGWATKVIDYGKCISNISTSSPSTETIASRYPSKEIESFTNNEKVQLLQYLKIQDALILQPGIWKETESQSPYKDFTPNYTNIPVLRIILESQITEDFNILLTGFTNRAVIAGISGIDSGSTDTEKPENGDFLGPEVYPWANKVIFMEPPVTLYYLRQGLKSYYKNLKIDIQEDSIDTEFKVSYIKPEDGVSILGPTDYGEDITIGSKIEMESSSLGKNYIKIEQDSAIYPDPEDSTAEEITEHPATTTLTFSDIQPGTGIAYHKPSEAGGDVGISSIIGSSNNFIKVEQASKDNIDLSKVNEVKSGLVTSSDLTSNNYGYTTLLTPSPIVGGQGVQISGPSSPGSDVTISAPITITEGYEDWMSVTQTQNGTELTPIKLVNTDGLLKIGKGFDENNRPIITIDFNIDGLLNSEDFLTSTNPLWNAIQNILNKVVGGSANSLVEDSLKFAIEDEENPDNPATYKYVKYEDGNYYMYVVDPETGIATKLNTPVVPGEDFEFYRGPDGDAFFEWIQTPNGIEFRKIENPKLNNDGNPINTTYTGDINWYKPNSPYQEGFIPMGTLNIYSSNNKYIRTQPTNTAGDLRVN